MPDLLTIPIPGIRHRILFAYRVSLYAPAGLAPLSGDEEAQDEAFETVPRYTNVPCYYQPTPEFTNVAPQGLNKEENVFTSDKWWFLGGQEVADGWLVVMTACRKPHSLIGRCWTTQGNSEVIAALGRRNVNSAWIYAKLSPTSLIPGS